MSRRPTFEEGFKIIEKYARDPTTPDGELSFNLAHFMSNAGYRKSPFNMKFPSLVRGRSLTALTIEDAMREFKDVSRLSYPPPFTKPRASRCNAEGQSAFYCAGDTGVPVFELRAELDQYVVLAFFLHQRNPLIEISIPIIGSEHIHRKLSQRDPNHPLITILEQDIYFKKKDRDEVTIELDRRLANWFSQPVTDKNRYIYRLTNAYYDMFKTYMSNDGNQLNGMLYPSIESESSGYNVVLEPKWVDDNLRVSGATIYKVVRKDKKHYSLAPLKNLVDIKPSGDIIWDDYLWELRPDSPSTLLT